MKPNKIKLDNGLRIITALKKESLTATILILVSAGSKYESKNISGISHFLEHMCFKGTKKRPRAIDISHELDSLGASYNAFTGQEFTGYYAKVDPTHINQAIDIVSDIYLNQIFRDKEIETESGVIIEELNMYEDDPRNKNQVQFIELLYGDQPAGWDIGGNKKVIRLLGKKDFEEYREKHYVAEGTVVVITGKFNKSKILKIIENKFSKISTTQKGSKKKVVEEQGMPHCRLHKKKLDQSHITLGFRAFNLDDNRVPILKVLGTILGGGMSSRLFELVREKMGAAYYVYSFTDLYTDHGYLAVSVGANNEKALSVVKAILGEFQKLKKVKVSKKELDKTKDYMIGHLSMGLETSDNISRFYGMQEILSGDIKTPKEIMNEIRKVTSEDIQNVAKIVFQNKNLNLSILGSPKNSKNFERILRV